MDEIRLWWSTHVKAFFGAVDRFWDRLFGGILDDWNVAAFILAMCVVVILTGIGMFRRRA